MKASSAPVVAMHWFRKGLRLSDNLALAHAIQLSTNNEDGMAKVYPVYVLDSECYQLKHCSALRANFLLECLQDLDDQLRTSFNSRLYVVAGDPVEMLPKLWELWQITDMTCETDETGEPYATSRDSSVAKLAEEYNVAFHQQCTETLFSLAGYLDKNGDTAPYTMSAFQKVFNRMGPVADPLGMPTATFVNDQEHLQDTRWDVPQHPTAIPWPRSIPRDQVVPIWNASACENLTPMVRGGERKALERLQRKMEQSDWVARFEKPKTSYTETKDASTLILSPYLSLGCVSPRTVWKAISDSIAKSSVKSPSRPPVSLHGQLLWREFNNLIAHACNVEMPGSWGIQSQMIRNPNICRDIPWSDDPVLLKAWKEARTGYPWIDACLTQLRETGWIHHLGRHALACFLSRGDLFQSWEKGARHFECELLDADYALNTFNWLWLSCSAFFYQYFRCYSPVAFAQKHDKSGAYIRKWLPVLAKVPDTYIYEPWKASPKVLLKAGVKLGENYPHPIVEHSSESKENMAKIALAYDAYKSKKEGGQKRKAPAKGPKSKK